MEGASAARAQPRHNECTTPDAPEAKTSARFVPACDYQDRFTEPPHRATEARRQGQGCGSPILVCGNVEDRPPPGHHDDRPPHPAPVAQWIEQAPSKRLAAGSSPAGGATQASPAETRGGFFVATSCRAWRASACPALGTGSASAGGASVRPPGGRASRCSARCMGRRQGRHAPVMGLDVTVVIADRSWLTRVPPPRERLPRLRNAWSTWSTWYADAPAGDEGSAWPQGDRAHRYGILRRGRERRAARTVAGERAASWDGARPHLARMRAPFAEHAGVPDGWVPDFDAFAGLLTQRGDAAREAARRG